MGSGQGDRWSGLQALQDPRHQEVRRPRPHRDAPEAEGELEEVLQGQEVQTPGPPPQEDQSHPQGTLRSREEPEVGQGPSQAQVIPHEEIRRQGLNSVSCLAKTEIKISFKKKKKKKKNSFPKKKKKKKKKK